MYWRGADCRDRQRWCAPRTRDPGDVPGLAQVAAFRAVLGAAPDALREYFDATVQGDPGKWVIELKPRQAQPAQYLGGMRLSGGRFVEEIRISETGYKRRQHANPLWQFAGAAVLNEAELSLFVRDSADRTGTARHQNCMCWLRAVAGAGLRTCAGRRHAVFGRFAAAKQLAGAAATN